MTDTIAIMGIILYNLYEILWLLMAGTNNRVAVRIITCISTIVFFGWSYIVVPDPIQFLTVVSWGLAFESVNLFMLFRHLYFTKIKHAKIMDTKLGTNEIGTQTDDHELDDPVTV